jgi:RES domain
MTEVYARSPQPTHRLIASRFPPIGLFDTIATAADLEPVMELAGWTNDRLVAERIARLPQAEWVYGRPNASIVMAAFLHVGPAGGRFNAPELGAWYASAGLVTAAIEVAHHMRREAFARGAAEVQRQFRQYSARLIGDYLDIRGRPVECADVYSSDSYAASQQLGERVRASGGAGILYDSIRHVGGVNIAAHRPRNVMDVIQTDHFEIRAFASSQRIELRKLS